MCGILWTSYLSTECGETGQSLHFLHFDLQSVSMCARFISVCGGGSGLKKSRLRGRERDHVRARFWSRVSRVCATCVFDLPGLFVQSRSLVSQTDPPGSLDLFGVGLTVEFVREVGSVRGAREFWKCFSLLPSFSFFLFFSLYIFDI